MNISKDREHTAGVYLAFSPTEKAVAMQDWWRSTIRHDPSPTDGKRWGTGVNRGKEPRYEPAFQQSREKAGSTDKRDFAPCRREVRRLFLFPFGRRVISLATPPGAAFAAPGSFAATVGSNLMSGRSTKFPGPWMPEEDAILIACWPDPNIDYAAIAKKIPVPRTIRAVKHRGYKIGLGQKARHKAARKAGRKFTPWPPDMPNFEDHPGAAPSGPRAKAIRLGAYFLAARQEVESSPTGSSLDGAAIFPTGRRV